MRKKSTSGTLNELPIKAADIASGRLVLRKRAPGGKVLPAKRCVNIYLDSAIVEHFKDKAGERGYQTLINETLKDAIQSESIERTIRAVIRQELKPYKVG
jgi:uncharacterized protein (DUF4415 family)